MKMEKKKIHEYSRTSVAGMMPIGITIESTVIISWFGNFSREKTVEVWVEYISWFPADYRLKEITNKTK